jgi:GNAT superfamily N-acetyltransferase
MSLRLDLIEEFRVTPDVREQIRMLLHEGFPDAAFARSRTYLKQLPPRRMLAWDGRELLGHMGVEHRIVALPTGPAPVFGVIDLCVRADARGRGVASAMLRRVEELAGTCGVEFVLLFTRDDRLYRKHGYHPAGNRLRWLMIDEHETLGIADEALEELRVKAIGQREWVEGAVDLLGYQF